MHELGLLDELLKLAHQKVYELARSLVRALKLLGVRSGVD